MTTIMDASYRGSNIDGYTRGQRVTIAVKRRWFGAGITVYKITGYGYTEVEGTRLEFTGLADFLTTFNSFTNIKEDL